MAKIKMIRREHARLVARQRQFDDAVKRHSKAYETFLKAVRSQRFRVNFRKISLNGSGSV